MDSKNIVDATKRIKKLVQCLLEWDSDKRPCQDYICLGEREPEDGPPNDKKPWNRKQIGKLLFIVTVADPEWFIDKDRPIIYIGIFVELYNWKNHRQVHKIHGMVELEKMCVSMAKLLRNFGAHFIVEISLILHSAHIVFRDQEKIVFYVNNYIDWDQFNQLYVPDWPEKNVQNVDKVVQKLTSASTKATDLRKKEARKKQEVVNRWKVEAIAKKWQRDRGRSSLLIEDERYYNSETSIDLDQEDGLNPLGDNWN